MSGGDINSLVLRLDQMLRDSREALDGSGQFRREVVGTLLEIRDRLKHGDERFEELASEIDTVKAQQQQTDAKVDMVKAQQERTDAKLDTHIADEESMLAPLLERIDGITRKQDLIVERQDELYDVVQPVLRKAMRTVWAWASQKAREDGPLLAFIGSLIATAAGALYWIITGGDSLPKG